MKRPRGRVVLHQVAWFGVTMTAWLLALVTVSALYYGPTGARLLAILTGVAASSWTSVVRTAAMISLER